MYANCFKRIIDFVLSLVGIIVLSPLFVILILLGFIFMGGQVCHGCVVYAECVLRAGCADLD